MDFVTITENAGFRNPIFGDGVLIKGNTYYTYSEFAQETVRRGLGTIEQYGAPALVHLKPSHLHLGNPPRRILLFFTGGLGDAVTVATVLPVVAAKYGFTLDICCARTRWESVFQPMDVPGVHVTYPPHLDALVQYDAVITDITEFYSPRRDLRLSPVVQLCHGFHVDPGVLKPTYVVPGDVADRCQLRLTGSVKIGVNFESNGPVKSYPRALQDILLNGLTALGFEVYVIGAHAVDAKPVSLQGLTDLRGETSVVEMASVLKQMDLLLGVDSFAVHLANVLEVATLVMLSSTAPSSFGWHRHVRCLSSAVQCAPCFEVSARCALGNAECLAFFHDSIAPETILRRVVKTATQSFRGLMAAIAESEWCSR